MPRASSPPLRAFLSYASRDAALVDAFRNRIRSHHPDVELLDHAVSDHYDEHWQDECDRKIHESAVLLCLLGETTYGSAAVTWEIGRGLALGKRVVAVYLTDGTLQVPEILERNAIEPVPSTAHTLLFGVGRSPPRIGENGES